MATLARSVNQDTKSLVTVLLAIVASLAVHAVSYDALRFVDVTFALAPPAPSELEFIDVPNEEPEPERELEPEPEVEPEPEPEPEPARPVQRAEPDEPAPAPLDEDPPPEPVEPVDLPEVLMGTGQSGFTLGPGTRQEGPIRTAPRRSGQPDGEAGGTGAGGEGTGTGPATVPIRDLSRRPEPPAQTTIARCLEDNYPRGARRQGLEGVAAIRARINPNGSPASFSIRSESVIGEGFGSACIECLSGRSWSAPLDRGGNPVATRIVYTCQFRVRN